MTSDIKYLFEPRTIAIIGASQNPDKVGYKILENILNGGYQGKVFPVNLKGGEILERKVFESILKIEEEIDLAIIVIPAVAVLEAAKECAEKKVKFLVIVSSGFSEADNGEEEKRIVDFAREKGMRILGPNIFGIYSSKVSLNATFGGKVAQKGNVAIISQSGALGIALMGMTETEGMGLSSIVFEGNKSDLNEKDLLPYFIDDEQTKAIFVYLEGVKDGRELIGVLEKAVRKKPVIVIKAGISKRGAEAALSHTGSLAGEEKVFSAVMKQVGVLRASTLRQAIYWAKYLSEAPLPQNDDTLIITNGGGMGILATDACERYGVKLSDNTEAIKKNFRTLVPAFGSLKNPIDLTGQATAEDYRKALKTANDDSSFGSIICLGCETAVLDNSQLAEVFIEASRNTSKPILFAFVGGKEVQEKLLSLKRKGVPIFEELEEAVSCLGVLYQHQRNLSEAKEGIKNVELGEKIPMEVKSLTEKPKKEKRKTLLYSEAKEIASLLEIPLPKGIVAQSLEEAILFAEEVGFPVAAKIVSPQVVHKTDFGGVILDIANKDELADAYRLLLKRTKQFCPDCQINGVEIEEMVAGGVEMIVGAKKDQDFGTTVMVGLGGIYAETFKDIVFRAFPIDSKEAEDMVKELKSYPLLAGIRGEKKKDIEMLAETILKIGLIIENCPEITEIEINPLRVFEDGKGIVALDVRGVVS